MPTADAGPAPSGEFTSEAERSSQVSDFLCTAIPVKRLTIKTYVMLLLMMTFGTVGNVLLDRGMKNLGVIDLSSSLAIWKGVETVFVERHNLGGHRILVGLHALQHAGAFLG